MTDTTTGAATDGGPGRALTDVEKLAALDTYLKVLGETATALRAKVTADMGARHDERVGAFLPDGTKIASITRSSGSKKARVVDEAAALAWCQFQYPTEVMTVQVIRPAFLKKIMDVAGSLPMGSKGYDPATGEELPFVEVQQGSPYVTVIKTDEGKARMTALANGFARMLESPTAAETGPGGGTITWSDGKVTYPDWTGGVQTAYMGGPGMGHDPDFADRLENGAYDRG